MDKPTVTIEDFRRLLGEIVISLPNEDNPGNWFDEHGLDKEIQDYLVEAGAHSFPYLMMEGVAEGDDPAEILSNICSTMIVAGFTLGYEAHKQFGPPPPRSFS